MVAREITGALAAIALIAASDPAAGQQRPLVTEDPETVGSGLVLIEAGIDHIRDQRYVVSGLGGHLTSAPRLGVSVGLSPIASSSSTGCRSTASRLRAESPRRCRACSRWTATGSRVWRTSSSA